MGQHNVIKGTKDNDNLVGTDGKDKIISGKGDDTIDAGAGNDLIKSGKGNDTVDGGSGNDNIYTGKGDDIVTGGTGDDCIHLGKGNDTAIYALAENTDNEDFYHGGKGQDTLRLVFTKDEWLRQDIQADIAAYFAFLNGDDVPEGYWHNRSTFEFNAFNLTAKQFEILEIVVDGEILNPADEMVDAVDDIVTVSENSTISSNVLNNDNVPDLVASIELVDDVTKGILTFNADGTFTYNTNGEFDSLAVGESATETFTYKVIDADGDEDIATATITITGENDAPVATVIDAGTTNEDASTITIELLLNASDIDSSDDLDTESVMVSSSNTGRAVLFLIDNETGSFSLDPNQFNDLADGESETLTISYNVVDGNGGVTPNTATLLVEGRNDTPFITVTNPDPVLEGNFDPLNQTATDIQIVDVFDQTDIDDPDTSDTQNFVQGSISILADSSSATMDLGLLTIDQTTGEVSYDRNKFNFLDDNESAIFNVTYQVKSGTEIFTETLIITILGENDAPFVRRPLLDPIDEDTPLIITKADFLSSTTEFDLNDQGNLELVDVELNGASAPYGILVDNGNDTWTFTPSENFFTDLISSNFHIRVNFKVSDGTAALVQSDAQFRILPVNDAPTVEDPLDKSAPEDGVTTTLDLLSGASDVEGDTLTIANLTNPLPAGILLSGSILTIDPTDASFQHLAVGDSEIINLSYEIEDGNGGSVPQTAKITITGTNDAPMVASIIERAVNEDEQTLTIDLLEGATDVDDGETATLSVTNVSPLPFGLMLVDNTIVVDPSHTAFQHLAEGVDEVITVNYEIEDEQGAKVAQTAKITITGKNDLPEVGAIIEKSANEDDDNFIVDLLESASDPDDGETQTLSVANLAGLEAGLVQSGNTVTVDPSDAAFQSLAKDEPYIITLSYNIVDAQGGSTPQTAKITIIGKNDTPEIQSPVTSNSTEDDAPQTVDLLPTGAITDIDAGDVISVVSGTLSQTGGRMLSSAQLSGNSLTWNPNEFNDLGGAESENLTFTYDVTDSKGGTVTQILNLTVQGVNDAPVTAAIDAGQVSEDEDPITINLLDGQSDPDANDVLTIENIVALDNLGNTVTFTNNNDGTITIDPNQYDALNDGETHIVTVTYDVADGTTSTQNTAKLEVIGASDNLPPDAVDDVLEPVSEFLVNEFVNSSQLNPSIITLSNGQFVISWVTGDRHYIDEGNTAIVARIFNPDGSAATGEFLVNTESSEFQLNPSITELENGNFVITWDTGEHFFGRRSGDIKGRIFSSEGEVITSEEFFINDNTGRKNEIPEVAAVRDGGFFVTWKSELLTGESVINGRVFDEFGLATTPQSFIIDYYGSDPSVTSYADGSFIVTWRDTFFEIKAQNFNPDGSVKYAGVFSVNEISNHRQENPKVAVLEDGSLAFVWQTETYLAGTTDTEIKARLFNADGTPSQHGEFQVNSLTNNTQVEPSITPLSNGSFLITWMSADPQQGDISLTGIKGRIFNADGTPAPEGEFLINEFTHNSQYNPSVTALNTGGFVITWNSDTPQQGDTSFSGIKARIFDANGNPQPTSNIFLEDQIAPILQSDLLANDTDPDGDPLTITEVSATSANGATVTLNNDGTISYDPTSTTTLQALGEGETTTDTFTYTITDGNNEFDTATVMVTVLGQNDTLIAEADTYTLNEDNMLNVGASAGVLRNDRDVDTNDILTATLDQDVSNGTLIFNSDGSFKYTPNLNFNGEDSFTYILSDGTETTLPIEVILTVHPINDAPVVTDGQIIVDEDQSHTITLADLGYSDVDGDELSSITINSGSISAFKLDNNPITPGQQITLAQINAGLFTFAPPMNFNGNGSISFTASDGLLTSTPASLAFEVTPVNDTPVAVDDEFAVNANEVLTVAAVGGVLDNDTDVDATDILTVSNFQATSTLGAIVTVSEDGSLSYDATGVAAIQALGQGETQDDTFTYTISDGNGGQDTATVTVTVTGVNDAPEAVMDSAMVNEDGTVLIDVLDNDSDVNGDALTISDVSTPTNGMAVIENGQIRYTPNGNFSGIDTFTYTIDDGRGGMDTATVTVNINEIADEPTLTAEVDGRIGLDLSAPLNIMAAVTDLDGSEQVTQIKVSGLPQGVQLLKNGMPVGIVSEIEPGVVFLNPIEADGDSDLIGLTIAGGGEGVTDFTLTVEATVTDTNPETNDTDTTTRTTTVAVDVNQVPIAMDLEATTNEDVAVTIDALATASDSDGDELILELVNTSPENGTVEIIDNKLVYTPKADFSGQDSFDYQVRDGFGGVSIKTVTVNVAPIADTPDLEVTLGGETLPLGEAVALDIQAMITDMDDGPASEQITQIKVSGLPEGVTLSAGDVQQDGSVLLDPVTDLAGLTILANVPPAFDASFELSSLDGSNGFVLNGIDLGGNSGFSVSEAGDINGDGIDDLIIGAYQAANQAGESYVVFGQDTVNGPIFTANFDLSMLNGSNGFVLNGIDASDQSGYSVSGAGDFNGDGIDDLVIAARLADPNGDINAGESYVVFGSTNSFSPSLNLSTLNGNNGLVLNGIDIFDGSGISVSGLGDINGDGIDDLIIGANAAESIGTNNSNAGESYVVFGQDTINGPAFGASLDLSTLNGSNGFVLSGIDAGDNSGWSVSEAGDINGDGIDDLIIGAQGGDPNGDLSAGESYVVFGSTNSFNPSLNLSTLNGNNGFILNGIDGGDQSGYSVSGAGDINGDGIDDLIIGANFADLIGVDNSSAGESYVVFGQDTVTGADFSASLDLSTLDGNNGFVLNGLGIGDQSGVSVSGVGDINGDSFDDLIIGARYADPNGVGNAGESYVVFGQDTVNGPGFGANFDLSMLNGSNGFVLNGIDFIDNSGWSVSGAGDINGDGIDDLIIGAPVADPNGVGNAGESYVVFGRQGLAPEDFQLTVEATVVDTNPDNAGDTDTAVGSTTLDVDVNQNPTIEAASFTVDENEQQVGTISFSDPDGDDVTIALTSNAATDNALFAIDPQTGLLTFIDSNGADFENPLDIGMDNIYDIEVEVTDSNGAFTLEQFQVTVDDVGQAVLEISGLDPFNLGSILLGNSINTSLVITNTGMEDATDLTIDFVDPNGPFSVTGGSITLDGDLQIGASEVVSFSFQPNVTGVFNDTLQVNYFNGDEFDITTRDVMGTAN